MGNKTAGRAMAALPFGAYTRLMGGDVTNLQNSGSSFTNLEVFKYFKELRTYALNRVRWLSDKIPEDELRLIEWHIFHTGYCAMLRPKIQKNNVKFVAPMVKIYNCNFVNVNNRNGWPRKINILNSQNDLTIVFPDYFDDEFVIFTDEYLFPSTTTPLQNLAWEYACKLHELDLAFNANSHRLRMPFVFSNAGAETESDGTFNMVAGRGIGVAETMRSAFGRNEQFVEIPDAIVGEHFLHEPQHVQNHMLEHLEAQKKLYDAYFQRIGLQINKEKAGSYTVKELQQEGDQTPNYITKCVKSTRQLCAEKAANMFGITLTMEIIG